MFGGPKQGKSRKNIRLEDLNVDLSKRFKYEGPKDESVPENIFDMLYQVQTYEYSHFLKSVKGHAVEKITQRPK